MRADEIWHVLGSLGGGDPRQSEFTRPKALMVAVFEDGIRSYCGPAGWCRTQAEVWVSSNRRFSFSFLVICDTLGLEPDAVRKALPRLQVRSMPRRQVRRTSRLRSPRQQTRRPKR